MKDFKAALDGAVGKIRVPRLIVVAGLALTCSLNVMAEPEERTQEELAQEAERAFNMFLRDQKVLFAKGEFEFEFSLVHASDTQHNVRFDNLVVPTLTSSSTTLSFLARYALSNNVEINFSVPVKTDEREYDFLFLQRPETGFESARESGVGDLVSGLRIQWLREQGRQPDVAFSLNYKPDTGNESSGSNDASLSLKTTLVKTIDPVVFYFELGYEYTWENEGVDRGNSIFSQFGTGFSLNDRVSYNAQYIIRVIDEISFEGNRIEGTGLEMASLQLGTTVRLSKDVFFEPFLNFGLSDDANDVSFGFSLPF